MDDSAVVVAIRTPAHLLGEDDGCHYRCEPEGLPPKVRKHPVPNALLPDFTVVRGAAVHHCVSPAGLDDIEAEGGGAALDNQR